MHCMSCCSNNECIFAVKSRVEALITKVFFYEGLIPKECSALNDCLCSVKRIIGAYASAIVLKLLYWGRGGGEESNWLEYD